MTNKKFKVAAMSMALTACVAAQPLIANAVEPGDANEPASTANGSAAPSEEPAAVSESAPPAAAAESGNQSTSEPESTNESTSEKSGQETVKTEEAFGDDVDVKYDHDHPQTDEKTGSTTLTGEVVKKDEDKKDEDKKDETGDQGKADGGQKTGETVDETKPDEVVPPTDGSNLDKDEDKKSEFGGSATKTETPDGKPEVSAPVAKPGAEPRPDPDPDKKPTTDIGSDGTITITTPTLTDGTQTTTTTGSGHAKADTEEKTPESTEIDLNEELGKNADIKWSDAETAEKGTPVGDNGYKIDSVRTDGNKQTLTLIKEDPPKEGRMTSDDVAKLVDLADAEKTDNDDGSYTLKRTEEIQDKDGKTITRTTYITVNEKDSHVSIKSSTTLVLSREKEEHHEGDTVDVSNNFKLPDIPLNNTATGEKGDTISSEKLGSLIEESRKNGTYTTNHNKNGTQTTIYTVKEGNREYTITVDQAAAELSAEEIADKLGKDYKVEKDENDKSIIYYVGNGQHAALTVGQTKDLREHLSYTVDVKETNRDTKTTVEGKDTAEAAAKNEAVRNALKAAVKEMLDKGSITKNEAAELEGKINSAPINANENGIFTAEVGKKSFTLNFTAGTIESPTTVERPDKDKNSGTTTDNKDLIANGSSTVTSGTVTWTDDSKADGGTYSVGTEWKLPEQPAGSTITSTTSEDGKVTTYTVVSADGTTTTVYEVTEETVDLSDSEKQALAEKLAWEKLANDTGMTREALEKAGYKVSNPTFDGSTKKVSWTAKQTVTKTTEDEDSRREVSLNDSVKKNDDGTYTIKVNGKDQTGFESSDGKTFTKTEGKKTITITVTDGEALDEDAIKGIISSKYNLGSVDLKVDLASKTASYTDPKGKKHTFHYDHAVSQTLSIKEETKENINKTSESDLIAAVKEKLGSLKTDDQLQISGKKTYTIKKNADNTYTITDGTGDLGETIKDAAEVENRITEIIKTIASNYINYGDLSGEDIWNLLDIQQVYADGKDNEYITSDKDCTDSYWPEDGYQNIHHWDGNVSYGETGQPTTTFGHMSLDAEVSIKDEKSGKTYDDGLILSEGLSFKYGHKEEIAGWCDKSKYPDKSYMGTTTYDKDDLHKTTGAKDASLSKDISVTSGQIWRGNSYERTNNKLTYSYTKEESNAFSGKRFYNISGQVAYDRREQTTNETIANAKLDELKEKGFKDARIVSYTDHGQTVYNVYAYVTNLNAIGYMTASANTSANQNRDGYNWQERRWDTWTPGCGSPYFGDSAGGDYDLRIQGLKLVDGKVQGNYGVKYSLGLTTTRNTHATDNILTVDKTTTTTTTENSNFDRGNNSTTAGSFRYNYTQDHKDTLESPVNGTGHGDYTSFVKLIDRFFHGESDELTKDNGSFTYSYDYTTVSDLDVESVTRTVKKHAEVDYRYTIEDVRDVEIPGKDIVHITPNPEPDPGPGPGPGPNIIDENSPDSPVLPSNPELPPVQDARPDAPVLPSDPVLPAVQDAHALPQTGVNWLTAIGLALSGMTLMITGAFASLTGKNAKH